MTERGSRAIICLDSLDMKGEWQLQTAKNRLSRVVEEARSRGPQTITVHGKPAAVLLSYEEYKRLASKGPSLSRFFAASPLRGVDIEPAREADAGRDVNL